MVEEDRVLHPISPDDPLWKGGLDEMGWVRDDVGIFKRNQAVRRRLFKC